MDGAVGIDEARCPGGVDCSPFYMGAQDVETEAKARKMGGHERSSYFVTSDEKGMVSKIQSAMEMKKSDKRSRSALAGLRTRMQSSK